MKKLSILTILLIAISTSALVVIFNQSLKDKIIKSFSAGDVETLSTFFAEGIFLELLDNEEYDDQAEIKKRLKIFFEQYPPKSFKIRHESGIGHKKTSYLIGILQTEEEVFRVNLTIQEDLITDIAIIFEAPIG